jgi:mRNA deadenylase 3'-5' endonuclease subunit Ccr4
MSSALPSANKPSLLPRTMLHVKEGDQESAPAATRVTVMTWNTLAQSLCDAASFPHTKPTALAWEHRASLIEEALFSVGTTTRPSIIALQEMDATLADSWLAPLAKRHGMAMMYAKKASDNNQDGCALLVDTAVWCVRSTAHVPLGPEPTSSQVALMACLETVATRRRLTVASVHLKSKPGHEARRLGQVRVLLEAMSHQEVDTLVLGDFNDVPDSIACQAMRDAGFVSLYDTQYPGGAFYTTAKKRAEVVCRTIDYVWCKSKHGVQAKQLLTIPPIAALSPDLLPSIAYPSDHLALSAQFAFARA